MAMLKPKLKMKKASKPKNMGAMHSAVERQRKSELQMPKQMEQRKVRGYS